MAPGKTKVQVEIDVLQFKIKRIYTSFEKVLTLGKKAQVDASLISHFRLFSEEIKGQMAELEEIVDSLCRNYSIMDKSCEFETYYGDEIEKVYSVHSEIKSLQASLKILPDSGSTNPVPAASNGINLPHIKVPIFSGSNINDWFSFRNLFDSLVHNNSSLTVIEKFHYLRTSLVEPAASLIKNLPLLESNYAIAYDNLVAKYEDKRILATNYVDKILNLTPVQSRNQESLEKFVNLLTDNYTAFKNLQINDPAGFILLNLVLRLLDTSLRTRFEAEISNIKTLPSFSMLIDFLQKQVKIYETAKLNTNVVRSSKKENLSVPKKHNNDVVLIANLESNNDACFLCKAMHKLSKCPIFISKKPQDRYECLQKTKRGCYNCLSLNHYTGRCKSNTNCTKCGKRHHTLLHFEKPISQEKQQDVNIDVVSNHLMADMSVILGTAVTNILDFQGHPHTVRLVIDPGATCSIISTRLVNKLRLKKQPMLYKIHSVGQRSWSGSGYKVECTLLPELSSSARLHTVCLVQDNPTVNLPASSLPGDVKARFMHLPLADTSFDKSAPIDFVLGCDLYPEIIPNGNISPIIGTPSAIPTIFGFVIMGRVPSSPTNEIFSNFAHTMLYENNINESLKRFWELEEPAVMKVANPEDILAEEDFLKNHRREETGRYVVTLPFKSNPPSFKESKQGAKNRLLNLERRFAKNSELANSYKEFMTEYKQMKHMQLSCLPGKYYIPHHGVFKNQNSKIRVVFDASSSTKHGSLNQHLCTGPKLQLEITHILSQFRMYPVVFTADIAKMYRQILVKPEHRAYQHILWRESPKQQIDDYELNTVTYGIVSAPFLALRTLKQLVIDEGVNYPLAANVLLNSIYVDDIVTGANSLEEAHNLKSQLVELLNKGGFELKKWTSNSSILLESIPEEDCETKVKFNDSSCSLFKILGIQWEPENDVFSYNIKTPTLTLTKRAVLSVIASIFDPLGWIAPVIFCAKSILQQIWVCKLDWDTPLPKEIEELWKTFVEELQVLKHVRIPRHMVDAQNAKVTILGFCDASKKGYAACIYLKCASRCTLLIAKTRVAPLKCQTIPRLELCGALLLVETYKAMKHFFEKLNIEKTYFFTDSSIVLSWIQTPPHLLKTFVCNRVAEIQRQTDIDTWYHVCTDHNPADLGSRGTMPNSFVNERLWFDGPKWALLDSDNWPIRNACEFSKECVSEEEEFVRERSSTSLKNLGSTGPVDSTQQGLLPRVTGTETPTSIKIHNVLVKQNFIEFEKFSKFTKLQRTYAYVLRFINNCRFPDNRCFGPLSVKELENCNNKIIMQVQHEYFADDLILIKKGQLSKRLAKLTPFIDELGLLRVGGRLQHATLNYNSKHPILLPKCHVTNILIDYFHIMYGHPGPHLLQALIFKRYWVINARNIIRHRIHKCLVCYKLKATPKQPIMGNLPKSRLEQGYAFKNVGVDFAGPFFLKTSIRKNAPLCKAYLCVFVCMCTKAVHLEVVSNLTTEAFIACFDRFVGRRGLPSDMYSDCGTNFIGAAKEFGNLFKMSKNQTLLINHTAQKGISWHFNPPNAPNFGGLWESVVKSAKAHLLRICQGKNLTFEEMTTLFVRIEAILNSRPLCPLSSSPDDFDYLTPGHFLIGKTLLAIPEHDVTELKLNRLSRWELVRNCAQNFWKRWKTEYLHQLNPRSKWLKPTENLNINDLVLIVDQSNTPLSWKTGRIIALHPGEDTVIRVVSLKTSKGILKRPVSKVVPFPTNETF